MIYMYYSITDITLFISTLPAGNDPSPDAWFFRLHLFLKIDFDVTAYNKKNELIERTKLSTTSLGTSHKPLQEAIGLFKNEFPNIIFYYTIFVTPIHELLK
jgi:hypothetical protein